MKKYSLLLLIICCFHAKTAYPYTITDNEFFSYKPIDGNPLKKIVKEIAKYNFYDATRAKDNNQVVSKQETNYQELLNTATPEQLTELATNSKNAVVRLYAFRALMEKVKSTSENVYNQFTNDKTLIKVINGENSEMKPLNTISNGFLY